MRNALSLNNIYAAAAEDILKVYIYTCTYTSQSLYIYIYKYIYMCAAAAAAETSQTAADVPMHASMPYCARLCSHYLLYMLFWVEPVTWWPMVAIWHGGCCWMKIAFVKRNNAVVSFGTLKVQSFMLTEVRECDLLIVVTSSTFLERKDILKEKRQLDQIIKARSPAYI